MREDKRYELEVHVAPITFRNHGGALEVLIAKRAPTRSLYPNQWECGGGQVYPGENFEDAVRRQAQEEFKIDIEILAPFGCYEIDVPSLPQKKIPGIKFLCRHKSGEARIDGAEHTEFKWQPITQLDGIDFLGNLREDIEKVAVFLS